MTPLDRLVRDLAARLPVRAEHPDRPHAAVALLLVPDPDRLLLIRRAERAGDPWSGQLALPGGRRQREDEDLLATAIRETLEETAVALTRDWMVAALDDLAPMTPMLPPIVVRPFVFRVPEALPAGVSSEVAHAGWVELEALTGPGVFRRAEIDVRGTPRSVEGYHLPEGFLWGMTERIVTPVVRRWEELRRG